MRLPSAKTAPIGCDQILMLNVEQTAFFPGEIGSSGMEAPSGWIVKPKIPPSDLRCLRISAGAHRISARANSLVLLSLRSPSGW